MRLQHIAPSMREMREGALVRPASWLRRASMAGFAAAVLLPAAAWSEPAHGAAEPGSPRTGDPRTWLMRAYDAARVRNYEGTLVSSDTHSVTVWRVAHFADADQQYERVDALAGEAFTLVRHNDVVHKYWQRTREAEIEQRDARAVFPALAPGGEQRVLEWYELRPLGIDRIAGYEADVVMLKARDAMRFSQRLWAERQSGLLLRADILGPNGQILEWSAFSDIAIGVKPRLAYVMDRLRNMDGYRVRRPAALPTNLDNEGWQLGALPAGFKQVQCAKRALDPAAGPSAPIVLQSIFSDGLTHVSLFVEPFDPKRHQGEVVGSIGATHTLMTRRDDQWVTVMGDVPFETLKRFAAALERKR